MAIHQEDMVSWEPEGHYHYSTMFCWEPEGGYRCTKSMAIAPFWFSTVHLLNSVNALPVLGRWTICGLSTSFPERMKFPDFTQISSNLQKYPHLSLKNTHFVGFPWFPGNFVFSIEDTCTCKLSLFSFFFFFTVFTDIFWTIYYLEIFE